MAETSHLQGAGTLDRLPHGYRVKFVREYEQPLERLWEAISSPEGLDGWYPTTLRTDGVVGHRVRETFRDANGASVPAAPGTLTAFEPPHVFEYHVAGPAEAPHAGMLGDQTIRMEVRSGRDGRGSSLVFTHEVETLPTALDVLGGWHFCLERLSVLMGAPGQPTRENVERYERYYRAEFGGAG